MNIIITGASQGIGREIVKEFAKDKSNKIIGIARNKERLASLEDEFSTIMFKGIVFDLSTIFNNGNNLLSEISNYFPKVDILINNAGSLYRKPFEETTSDEINQTFTTNVFVPAELIRLLLPFMSKESRSHIVNISSMAGFQGSVKFAGLAWYSASKAAIACLTECLANEFKDRNIAVNSLALGAVQTEMLAQAFPGYTAQIQPQQMAKFIANFASTAHKVMNGAIIPVTLSNP